MANTLQRAHCAKTSFPSNQISTVRQHTVRQVRILRGKPAARQAAVATVLEHRCGDSDGKFNRRSSAAAMAQTPPVAAPAQMLDCHHNKKILHAGTRRINAAPLIANHFDRGSHVHFRFELFTAFACHAFMRRQNRSVAMRSQYHSVGVAYRSRTTTASATCGCFDTTGGCFGATGSSR